MRKRRTMARVRGNVSPAFSARKPAAWIAGPSAIGSVKAMPSSMMSAPALGRPRSSASEVSGSGSPDVMKVTRPARPADLSSAKRRPMRVVRMVSLMPALALQLDAERFCDREHVLVAAAADVHHQQIVLRQGRRQLRGMGQRVRRLERRQDALELGAEQHRLDGLLVGGRDIFDAALVLEPGMLRPDA